MSAISFLSIFPSMLLHSHYLDPTYPAYYDNFHRSKTLLCFSLRQFLRFITMIDTLFSAIGFTFALIYLSVDQLSSRRIEHLRHIPIGIFFNNRILFQSAWTIESISTNSPIIFYLHALLNGLALYCAINMLMAIKYHKPHRAWIYLVHEAAYFVHTSTIFVRWIVANETESNSIGLFYGRGDLGFFTNDLNIFCLVVLELFWKSWKLILIFRSIQYLRDYNLRQSLSSKTDSQTFVIIHVIPNEESNI